MDSPARAASSGAGPRSSVLGRGRDRYETLAAVLVPALVSIGFLVTYWGRMLSHDVAWYVLASRDWLGGAVLYRDVLEVNPPLNFYLTVPAVVLSDLLHLSPENGAYVAFALLVFGALHWCFRILSDELGKAPRDAALLTVAIAASILVPSGFEQIQRDGLLLVFMMPWLLSQMGDRPNAPGVGRTIFFGIGICLKPYFIVFPLFLAAFQVLRQRSLRAALSPSNLILLGVGVCYGVYVALVHPLYFSYVVPLAGEVYGSVGASRGVLPFWFAGLGASIPVLLAMAVLRPRAFPAGTDVLATAALAGLASYLWQGKGFGYHLYPFLSFTCLLSFWILLQARGLVLQRLLCLVVLLAVALKAHAIGFYRNPGIDEILRLTEDVPATSIWVASTDLAAGPAAALAMRRAWAVRYPHNWIAPGVANGLLAEDCATAAAACDRLAEVGRLNATQYMEDLEVNRPGLAVIDKAHFFIRDGDFDWYAYLAAAPSYERAMARYRLHASSDRYDVYVRNP